MNKGWSWGSSLRESILNILHGRGFVELVGAVIVGSTLAALYTVQWVTLDSALEAERSVGRDLVTFGPLRQSDSDFRITVASCSNLAKDLSVAQAGVIVPQGFVDIAQLGPKVPLVGVSAGLLPPMNGRDAYLGSALGADLVGAEQGQTFAIDVDGHEVLQTAILERFPDGIPVNSALVAPLDPVVVSSPSCVAQLVPFTDAPSAVPRLAASLTISGGQMVATVGAPSTFDVVDAFLGRLERYLGPVVGVAMGLASAMYLRARGSEIAAYRLSGTSGWDYLRIALLGQIVLAGVTLFSGSAAMLLLGLLLEQNAGRLAAESGWLWFGSAARILVFGYAIHLFVHGNPMSLAKER